jgi:hypothetical protein
VRETPPAAEEEGAASPTGADPKADAPESREERGDAGRTEATGSPGPDQEPTSSPAGSTLVVSAAAAILAIYILFFRR